ncbi:asparagine-linked glycosylation protein [Zygosaccharomyces mellis]|uniref:GDP-Man:Man(3)GlcNAc(2)-PP-Dol alpha-1,2-mannosyltransferase n=1 Tax=Zygosaccharomyces mellis TaxID=42258 RepID=A0A4C2E423_9SACH|nr:asparagine-linked glycosylation protein [Zygosaccharomyces mellis]
MIESSSLVLILASVLVTSLALIKGLIIVLPNVFLRPPARYRARINNAMKKVELEPRKNVQMDFGWKHGSVRRQMILAAAKPCEYGNGPLSNNQISIGVSDKLERKQFVNLLVPELRTNARTLYGFFHPYCNAGGGGEKVLWKAVQSTLARNPGNVALIYTGDTDATPQDILHSVGKRFDYELDKDRIVFIYLEKRRFVDSKMWPHFTLLGQALGSSLLTAEALYKCPPDVWCDTMGYPFGYPVVYYLTKIPIITYTHYPVISTDMLNKLKLSRGSKLLKTVKYCYWTLFMMWYRHVGSYVTTAVTNSTWTNNHIKQIWNNTIPRIIYPPCSTEKLVLKHDNWERKNQVVVIAQFRPEKRHELIIASFAQFIGTLQNNSEAPVLILIGSTRSQEDRAYVHKLSFWAHEELKVPRKLLKFHTDCPYDQIKQYLSESTYGINAMWNEHFGIAVVEYVASGLIPLVHASAGPLLDIVVPWDVEHRSQVKRNTTETRTGFFFKDKSDPDYDELLDAKKYPTLSELFVTVINLTANEKKGISKRGRECVLHKFSDFKFHQDWSLVLEQVESRSNGIPSKKRK